MKRRRISVVMGLLVACFGSAIALGALLTSIGVQTGIDGDSVLVGAGIAVGGAGAAFQLSARSSEPVADRGPIQR